MYIYIDFWSVLLFNVYIPTTCMKKYSIDISKYLLIFCCRVKLVKIGGCIAVKTLADIVFTK